MGVNILTAEDFNKCIALLMALQLHQHYKLPFQKSSQLTLDDIDAVIPLPTKNHNQANLHEKRIVKRLNKPEHFACLGCRAIIATAVVPTYPICNCEFSKQYAKDYQRNWFSSRIAFQSYMLKCGYNIPAAQLLFNRILVLFEEKKLDWDAWENYIKALFQNHRPIPKPTAM